MPDRGIINNRKGSVTSGRHDIVLVPGANRVTQEQLDKLMAEPAIKMLFDAKELTVVAEVPAAAEKPAKGEKGDGGTDPNADKTKK